MNKSTDHVCRICFIPRDKNSFRQSRSADTITQFIINSEFTIGSGKDANIVYKSKGVHGLHAKVKIVGREFFITDLFSPKGVSIGGNKIAVGTPVPVKSGEYIHLGNATDLITIELFRKPLDPKLEGSQILHEAETKAIKLKMEADKIMKEAGEVENQSNKIIEDAREKAAEIILAKKQEAQEEYEKIIEKAKNESVNKVKEENRRMQQGIQKMRFEAEKRGQQLVSSREEEAKALVEQAKKEAEQVVARGKEKADHIVNDAKIRSKDLLAGAETRKQKTLQEKSRFQEEIQQLGKEIEAVKASIDEVNKNRQLKEEEYKNRIKELESFDDAYEEAKNDHTKKLKSLETKFSIEKSDIEKKLANIDQTLQGKIKEIEDQLVIEKQQLDNELESYRAAIEEEKHSLKGNLEQEIESQNKTIEEFKIECQQKRQALEKKYKKEKLSLTEEYGNLTDDLKEKINDAKEKISQEEEKLKKSLAEANEEFNREVLEINSKLQKENDRYVDEIRTAENNLSDYIEKCDKEKEGLTSELNELRDTIISAKEDLQSTLNQNQEVIEEKKSNQKQKAELSEEVNQQRVELAEIKSDIQKALTQKDQAIEEAEKQKEKTSQDIKELKELFEAEYDRRKRAEEERFSQIRKREEAAATERRALLKKHEKERLPHQIQAITSAIWNDLSIELQDQTLKMELFSTDNSIPKTIEKIVEKSIFEEFDFRTKLASEMPIYKEEQKASNQQDEGAVEASPMGKKPKLQWGEFAKGAFNSGAGALFMLALIYFVMPQNEIRQYASQSLPTTGKIAKKENVAKGRKTRLKRQTTSVQKDNQWKPSYSENILYTDNFLKFVKKQKTDPRLKVRLANFLRNNLGLKKSKIDEFILAEGSLVWNLRELVNDKMIDGPRKLDKMKALESKELAKLLTAIGGEKNFKSYLSFQADQYRKNYVE